MKKHSLILLVLVFSFYFSVQFIDAQEARVWQKYTGQINDATLPELPNYGFAGYKLGASAIPESTATVFDVTAYGAIANDDISDVDAIKAAISAAQNAGGGVVFFPPGEFIVNAVAGNYASIRITHSKIVLKGSGSGSDGTVINMKTVMSQVPGVTALWNTPKMFVFDAPYNSTQKLALTADSDKNSNYVTVTDASVLSGHKYVRMDMPANTEANSLYLDGKTNTRGIWSNINNKGVEGKEFHEIDRIEGNKVYFKDEFVNDIKAAHGWTVSGWTMMENSGFEDIHFKANFMESFQHHKNYIHDSGWSAIGFGDAAHCWVRRSRFSNVTQAVSTGHCYAVSIIQLLVDGNRGHSLVGAGGSSRILMGLIWDNTNRGQWHGIDVSGRTTGSVAWRIDAENGRGMDIHGSYPRSNLYDLYAAYDVMGNGGHYANLPNHLGGLTLWNHSRVGPNVSNFDFWQDCGSNYCNAAVANPIIVGYHGANTTFLQSNIKYEESNGTKVFPESLYEAQVEYRLGARPAWFDEAITEYDDLKELWYEIPVSLNYTETINNLSLVGWGQETYVGDNEIVWNVNAKGVSNYIDSSKEIYFQKGVIGIDSNDIPGGISSFSVDCKDLWEDGAERIIELLINDQVVGSMSHTGGEIYEFKVENINITGDIKIALRNASTSSKNNTIAINDISWTPSGSLSTSERPINTTRVYPNPTKDVLKIRLPPNNTIKKIVLIDLHGRTLLTQQVNVSDKTILLNLEKRAISKGVYLLQIIDSKSLKTIKIIKN